MCNRYTYKDFFISLVIAQCPLDHPFAYNNGDNCCKTNEERPIELGITPQNEIDDGTCDGVDFNRQSKCCKYTNTPCPDGSGCFDNYGKTNNSYIHLRCTALIGIRPEYKGWSTS